MSLRYKFIISFLSIEILFISLIVFFNFSSFSNLSKSLIEGNIATSTSLFVEMIKTPMAISDLGTLDDQTDTFTHMENIVSVKVFDTQKRLLSQSQSDSFVKVDPITDSTAQIEKDGHTYRLISAPVKYRDEALGHAEIVFETTQSLQVIKHTKEFTFLLIAMEIFISTLVAFFIGKRLTRELNQLTKAAENISVNEETELPVSVSQSYEVQVLFNTLGMMQDKILERKKRLLETLEALQDDIKLRSQLEQKLTNERNFISAVIENANVIIAIIQLDGTMTRLNRYGLDFLGYTMEEISGEPYFWSRFYEPDVQNLTLSIMQNAREGIIQKRSHHIWVSKNGEKRSFEWSNSLVRDAEGKDDYLIFIGTDITEVESSKQELQTIFDLSRDGIAILDLESNFLDFNDAYAHMTGFSREELLTKSCIGLSSPEDLLRTEEAIGIVLEQGYIESFEQNCIAKNGEPITVKMGIALMPDNKRLLISSSDITDLKQIETELITANKAKSDFLASMSHELRTPLNAILGFGQILSKNLDHQHQKFALNIITAGKHLLSLINDILDIAKVEAGKVELEIVSVELQTLIADIETITRTLATDKGLSYTVDVIGECTLNTDTKLLKQIIINQISNGIKFTQDGGITVKAYIDDRNAHFLIRDTGIGISQENLKKLFTEFTQINNGLQKYEKGTGLGLVLSKKYAQLLGGDLTLDSVEGSGTTAHIVIPTHYISENPHSHR